MVWGKALVPFLKALHAPFHFLGFKWHKLLVQGNLRCPTNCQPCATMMCALQALWWLGRLGPMSSQVTNCSLFRCCNSSLRGCRLILGRQHSAAGPRLGVRAYVQQLPQAEAAVVLATCSR